LAGRPPISPILPLLFGTTLFLPLHHIISEDFPLGAEKHNK
jgi:hypothetical protein